jgi:hypothetical protein
MQRTLLLSAAVNLDEHVITILATLGHGRSTVGDA